jgi:hypothetical protein
LSTDEPIKFLSSQLEMTGIGLQIDIDLGRMLVKDNVWMKLYPEDSEKR